VRKKKYSVEYINFDSLLLNSQLKKIIEATETCPLSSDLRYYHKKKKEGSGYLVKKNIE
jgi:hypothetical protein